MNKRTYLYQPLRERLKKEHEWQDEELERLYNVEEENESLKDRIKELEQEIEQVLTELDSRVEKLKSDVDVLETEVGFLMFGDLHEKHS